MKRLIGAAVVLCVTLSLSFAQQGDTESEIQRARKELVQLQTERKKNRLDMDRDEKKFKEYTKRTAERLAGVKNETDSINQQITVQKQRNDSLAALINYANSQVSQFDMSQEAMRKKLLASCDRVSAGLKGLPPMVRQNLVASSALLKNELRNKSVGNVEAINRMQQIMTRGEECTGSIQVSQESSPITGIRGQVYRLRVGTFFEAVVNMKGDECAVWYASDSTGWKTMKDLSTAAEIFKAATIREGKSMPAFVTLPLVADREKGGTQ
jgi:chromosome segregation ATPase